MADKEFRMAGGTLARVTALDACGVPQNCSIASKCVATVQITSEYVDPQDLSPVNMDGSLCWVLETPAQLKWERYTFTFNSVNLRAWSMMTGGALYFNEAVPTPEAVGVSTTRGQIINANFAIELWKRQAGEVCTDPTLTPYVYWVGPWVTQGRIGQQTVQNGVVNGVIESARSGVPSPWGTGPYNVERIGPGAVNAGNPRPLLTAIGTTLGDEEISRELWTSLPPPLPYSTCLDPTDPLWGVTPTAGAAPLLVTGTFPLNPATGLPILPAIIDWADGTIETVTVGTTKTHTYATPGTRVAKFTPTAFSSPTYKSASIVAS